MKSPDRVFKELGRLYDFYKEIAKFRFKKANAAEDQPNERTASALEKSRRGEGVKEFESLDETFDSRGK